MGGLELKADIIQDIQQIIGIRVELKAQAERNGVLREVYAAEFVRRDGAGLETCQQVRHLIGRDGHAFEQGA
ncbi:MAG: hypothetical protein MUC99_06700, partial [Anaerolineae bacterium]|nr:hypothetical protein [Anaerolineae bacterium]